MRRAAPLCIGLALCGCGAKHAAESELDIVAPPSRVWAVLTDFAAYPEWNPTTRLSGEIKPGAVIENTQIDGEDRAVFHPLVLVASPDRELRWRGRLWGVPGLLEAEHYFLIQPTADGCELTQGERFEGALSWVPSTEEQTQRFLATNLALKARAEQAASFGR